MIHGAQNRVEKPFAERTLIFDMCWGLTLFSYGRDGHQPLNRGLYTELAGIIINIYNEL